MVYIRAQEGPPNYDSKVYTVQYFDTEGNMTIRSGGTKAWRNNNPGNMIYVPKGFAIRHGAIGKAAGMAVFASANDGRQALIDLLKSVNYRDLSINEFAEKYDKNNAESYRRMILSISKLEPHKLIKNLTNDEFGRFRIAIERIEGWEEGREEFIAKYYISAVRKKQGVITEYLIEMQKKKSWLKKDEAVKLACEGRLHVVIVHLRSGNVYLRPEFGNTPFQETA